MEQLQAIIGGLYRVSGSVNLFILDDADGGVAVVVAGMPRSLANINSALASINRRPGDIQQILITHADIDHVGSLSGLASATGAEVYAGSESKAHIELRTSPPHMPTMSRPIMWLMNKLMLKPAYVHHLISDGDTLPIAGGIRVIAAPGHTPDNYNFFWEREKVLFAADLLNTRGGTLRLTEARITWDMDIARQSARSVLDWNPTYICVGHGDFINTHEAPQQVEILLNSL